MFVYVNFLSSQTPLTAKVEPGRKVISTFLISQMFTEEACTNDFAGYIGILTLQDKINENYKIFKSHILLKKN